MGYLYERMQYFTLFPIFGLFKQIYFYYTTITKDLRKLPTV